MEEIVKFKLPKNVENISFQRAEILNELLENLYHDQLVLGVLLGGSISYKENIQKSDVDLFCLIQEPDSFEKNLIKNSYDLKNLDTIIYQGIFPWTEKLYTIYYKNDLDISIDVCVISPMKQEKFFWEPDGYILFDKAGIIESCRKLQINSPNYTRQPFLKSNPYSLAIVTLKKIEKNISRDHLWNALELLSILRRYLMQIVRVNIINDTIFLGRPDRDIEDILPIDLNKKFSATTAKYERLDIASKAIALCEMAESLSASLADTQEYEMKEWIIKQLKHERNKLSKYI
ncbi:MAG: aminoglycoside 6-adenylyltransferase [Bacteroidetes bacterium]|nr:aminoglycoside 6-adenylyltransferase [Bacteroidota bacterium]